MSRARELARLGNANAISIDTSNNVGLGTTTSIQYKLDVVGDANFVGVVTATSFGGDGSNLTGVAATDNINTNNIKVSGISTLGTATADSIVVGSAVTVNGSGIKAGIITANSFSGDGSSLTGVAATDYVVANTLKVLGVSTFVGNTQLTATTASTSSATGALVVSGGVGIAGSLHVGENVSVGGTLTYEDVTNVDVIGLVTARTGVRVTAGGLVVTAGVSTLGGGTTMADSVKSYWGTGGDLSIYHDGSDNYITGDVNGMDLFIRSRKDLTIKCGDNSSGYNHILYADNNGTTRLYHPASDAIKLKTATTGINPSADSTDDLGTSAIRWRNIYGDTLYGDGSNITNVSATASISTSFSTAAGIVSTLALSSSQDHKVTVSGISTFTCNGGKEGESHTLRITNSGITTIGFSTYFLFPGGSAPSIPTADGTVNLISFTVHRVGTPGIATQLLAGASVNFS